jgi:cobalt/nickel transport system permease protein
MHIVDGAVSAPLLIGGGACALVGTAIGLRQLSAEKLPQAAVISAVFFVASLVHVPIGISSVHLILNGLAGIILGWAAFPALLIALLLQAVFFGFGGITILGVNTLNIALPAIIMYYAMRPLLRRNTPKTIACAGAIAGAGSIILTSLFVTLTLMLNGEGFVDVAKLVVIAHLPVAAVEAVLSAAALGLLAKVRPEALGITTQPYCAPQPATAHHGIPPSGVAE